MQDTIKRIVERFELVPHPEGGFFREVYRSGLSVEHAGIPAGHGAKRRGGTLIYYLLAERQFSAFHRVRWTDEIWHLYAGGPLELHIIDGAGGYSQRLLASDLERGEPTAVVDAGCWQAARLAPDTSWAFGGCTVAPGFEFADFEMPPARDLLALFPSRARIIGELARE